MTVTYPMARPLPVRLPHFDQQTVHADFPITWGCLPDGAASEAVVTTANAYRVQARYSEDTFVTHNWDGSGGTVEVVGCPWHLARAMSQHLPGYRSVGVGIFLSCDDAFILQRRAQWVQQPGTINIIGESASVEDITNKELRLTNTAVRGVREELGVELTRDDVTFFAITSSDTSVAAFAYAHIPMPFASVMDHWEHASHRDEGVPVRMDCTAAREALRWRWPERIVQTGLRDCNKQAA